MTKKENKRTASRAKKAAAVSAVALLTAASVATGSLFDSPAALLAEDGTSVVCTVSDGAEDAADDADAGEAGGEETRRRGGARAALRERILRLPMFVRLLVILPLWALGSALIAAAGAAWTLLSPVLGKLAGFALLLALLAGTFLAAVKTAFPDLPLKKILSRRSLVALLLGAATLTAVDAALPLVWDDYGQIRNVALSVGFFAALCCAAVPFALREQKRRLTAARAAAERAAHPDKLTFTDGVGTFTLRVPDAGQ